MPTSVVVMVVLIVLISAIARIARARYDALGRQQTGQPRSVDTVRTDHEIQQLKERIQVLERVITDSHSSADLDRQIERLRDR